MRISTTCLACVLLFAFPAFAQTRSPVPSQDQQDKALALIKSLFKNDYAKTGASAKANLAKNLLGQGRETKDDSAARYILFREARDLAAKAGDLELSLQACDALVMEFEVPDLAVRRPAFEVLSTTVTNASASQDLTKELIKATDDAVAADDFETAGKLQKMTATAAGRARNNALSTLVAAHGKELSVKQSEFEKAKPSLSLLEKDPKNSLANLVAGQYVCFIKGDWPRGLPMLVKGPDAKLRNLATKDLAAPTTGMERLELADAWYDRAAALEGFARTQVQRHAYSWYTAAAPDLTGLNKVKAENRIGELAKVVEAASSVGGLWNFVHDGVRNKKYTESAGPAGTLGKLVFSDPPTEERVLIGFNFAIGKLGRTSYVLDYFQPIYLTPKGEKVGTAYGVVKRPVKPQTIKAKKGYAVGGLTVRSGSYFDGFSVAFMKMDGAHLKTETMYESDWIGIKGGIEKKFGYDGTLFVGVLGKSMSGGQLTTFGVYELPPLKK